MKYTAFLCLLLAPSLVAQSLDDSAPTPAATEKKEEKPFPTQSSTGRRNSTAEQLFNKQDRSDFALALELKDRGNYRAALRRFQDFRLLYPSHPQMSAVLGHIADIYEKLSLPERALSELRRYLNQHAGKPTQDLQPLLALQADIEYRLGYWKDAIQTSDRLVQFFPASPEAETARKRLMEMQAGLEADAEKPAPSTEQPTSPGKETEMGESSLDRLGEGLDIEN